MPSTAKQTVDLTSLIKGILNGYPGNSAIFREYLQNSDDAKAAQQVFVLDVRNHPTVSILDPILADTQGPALIAFNDQTLSDRDWTALQKIHASSKSSDETQTGKNGLGFRASYHLTENPQILSGRSLLILDPHDEFHQHPGGVEIDIVREGLQYADQLRSFESILKQPFKEFHGTVFRLPFRTQKQAKRSRIKNTPTSVAEMKELLSNFGKELEEAILFLKHITSIEIRWVSDVGEKVIGTVTIDPRPNDSPDAFTRQITVDISGEQKRSRLWKYYHYKVDRTHATAILSRRLRYSVGDFLTTDKLTADVELALPLDLTPISGRLFTLLPLPIRTGFPVHFNAVFALTPDRQSLKNIEETGTEQSRERRLIEWNRVVFDDFGAKAWARLLSDLAGDINNVWSAWPPEPTDENSYWISLVPNIIQEAKTLKIFPIINSSERAPLVSLTDQSILLAPQPPPVSLASLAKMGLSIVQPPSYIFNILTSPRFDSFFTKLSPLSSYERLRSVCAKEPAIPVNSAVDFEEITNYLVFWGNTPTSPAFERLINLPWFTFVDGSQTHLRRQSWFTGTFVVPGSEEETLLFDMPRVMLAWPCISTRLRKALSTAKARETLNVATLTPARILAILKARFQFHSGKEEVESSEADISWLLRFWKWVSGWEREEFNQLARGLGDLHILPTAIGTLKRWSDLSILLVADPAADLLNAWREFGIHILHIGLASCGIFQVLQDHKIGILPSEASYVSFLARNYRCDELSSITLKSRNALRSSIQLTLPWVRGGTPISLSPTERTRLPSLPIFSVRTGTGGPPSFHPISGDRRHVQVDDKFPLPILPGTRSLVFVDMNDSLTEKLARLVDATSIQILNEHELLTLAVEHWSLQPQNLMETFIERILDNLLKFPPAFCEKLKDLAFITVEGQTKEVAPRDVIDPSSTLVEVFKGQKGKFPSGRFSKGKYLRMMQSQNFFRSKLDAGMVTECLGYLTSKQDAGMAAAFLRLLNASWDESFAGAVIANREGRWMPSHNSPSECRDDGESPQQRYLYDHVFTILRPRDWTVSNPGLRKALGWADVVPFEVLAQQFSFTIRDIKLVDRTERLKYMISYFANYPALSSSHSDRLREIVKGASWVPVQNRKQPVSFIQYATLSTTSLGHPFYQAQQASEGRHHDFLSGMGCTHRPSIDTLVAELKEALSPELWSLSTAVPILQEIADHHQESILTRSDILVPTDSQEAHPLADTYYQDIMTDHILDIKKYETHSQVSKGLAEKLGIPLMSSLQLGADDNDDDELQMSEDLVGRIRGFLRENDIRFSLNEFLANADDAGAKQFAMKLVQGSHQVGSTMKVVSPHFQKLEKVSRLIIWNDSVFTQEDFKGMRRVGSGGKTRRGDTHGRHGLGALSLYYFTDVPMIISGDHILILDPSSRYLPPRHGQKRTSLFRKLSVFMRQFPDQLRSIHDNFNFSPRQATFNGTLFLLPLSSTIYEQGLPDYRELLHRTYKDLAANAFFFTRLTDIKAEDGARTLWHVRVDRRTDPLPLTDRFTYHHLQFTRENITEKWMITTSDKSPIPASQSEVARELKFLPNSSMPVQLAIRVDRRQNVGLEPSHLFSTLRLPKITSLPFHLHARFAISANRQNLVFYPPNRQNKRDPKSCFNAWILSDLVCPLYLAAFDHIIQAHPLLVGGKSQDWLIFKSDSDDISSYVGESLLGHIPGTELRLFASADRNWITFRQSVFSCDEPGDIRDVLTLLKTPTFVPGFGHTAIPMLAGAKKVTIAYLMERLGLPESFLRMSAVEFLEEPATVANTLSLRHVIALAQYVRTAKSFVGLPIIVGTTGKLYKVPSKSDPPIYVSQNTSHQHGSLFPTSVFLHDGYDSETINALVKSNLSNIRVLTEQRVVDIITVELGTFTKKRQCPSQWLRQLWQAYNTLPGPPSIAVLQRADLKIIGSARGYISVADCIPENVVQSPGSREKWIGPIMSMLGINVLEPTDRNVVGKYMEETFPDLFTNVIQCLGTRGPAIFDSFGGLDEKSHSALAAWMRTHQEEGKRKVQIDGLKGVLRKLPIWEAYYNGRMYLLPAHRIAILPPSIKWRTIAPYLNWTNKAVAVYSSVIIESLSYSSSSPVQPMTIEGLFDVLKLPNGQLQGTTQIRDYKNFLQEFLLLDCGPLRGKLRVPDDNLVLRLPGELFSHKVALFAVALKYTAQPSFLHGSFRDLTSQLHRMGLRQEINFQNFQACATAVDRQGRLFLNTDAARDQEIMRMADAVFHCYHRTLPGTIGTDFSQWNQLDNVAFVRCKSIRRQGVNHATESYCDDLPVLIPPSRLLRPDLEPIAWTMRGLFFTEPSDHLLAVNKSLGVPSTNEVVNHLRILATKIARRHEGNAILLSDLRATYKWLDSHHQEARKFLAPLSDVPLFLNVDDPQTNHWTANWVAADQLVLNLRFDMQKHRAVREFLQPYRSLLLVSGCRDLKLEKQPMGPAPSLTDDMSKLRRIFNEMRSRGELTDMCLVPKSPLIYHKCREIILYNDLGGLPAHKAFLAASIPHFRIMSQWVDYAKIEFDRSPFAAQAILDFCYTGSLKYPEPESERDEMHLLQEFCELLQKSDEWDMPALKRLLQKHIIEDHDMIQRLPQGFKLMYATATETGAEALKCALDRFRAGNGDILEQLNNGEGIEETQEGNQTIGYGAAKRDGNDGLVNRLVADLCRVSLWVWSWNAVRPVRDR